MEEVYTARTSTQDIANKSGSFMNVIDNRMYEAAYLGERGWLPTVDTSGYFCLRC